MLSDFSRQLLFLVIFVLYVCISVGLRGNEFRPPPLLGPYIAIQALAYFAKIKLN